MKSKLLMLIVFSGFIFSCENDEDPFNEFTFDDALYTSVKTKCEVSISGSAYLTTAWKGSGADFAACGIIFFYTGGEYPEQGEYEVNPASIQLEVSMFDANHTKHLGQSGVVLVSRRNGKPMIEFTDVVFKNPETDSLYYGSGKFGCD